MLGAEGIAVTKIYMVPTSMELIVALLFYLHISIQEYSFNS